MAQRSHPNVTIGSNDTVLLASSLIPGNENPVFRVINGLVKLGAKVVHRGSALVHVSGHASSGELLYCYNLVRPKNALPVHGEARHLIANGNLAASTGVEHVLTIDDGTVVDLHDGVATVVGRVEAAYVLVDGASVGSVSEVSLADRRVLGSEGFITVIAVVDPERTEVTMLAIHARGFMDHDEVFLDVKPQIEANLRAAMADGTSEVQQLQQVVRRTLGRWVATTLHTRPMILPVVIPAFESTGTSPV
jgi:ribonuclease J